MEQEQEQEQEKENVGSSLINALFEAAEEPAEEGQVEEQQLVDRLESARKLIKNLKILFASMAIGDKKYADPSAVAHSLTDDSGRKFQVGDERDIGEFSECFLSRL